MYLNMYSKPHHISILNSVLTHFKIFAVFIQLDGRAIIRKLITLSRINILYSSEIRFSDHRNCKSRGPPFYTINISIDGASLHRHNIIFINSMRQSYSKYIMHNLWNRSQIVSIDIFTNIAKITYRPSLDTRWVTTCEPESETHCGEVWEGISK